MRIIFALLELQKDVKDRNTAIRQVKTMVEKNYGITINEVDSRLSKLRNEIKKSKAAIDAFKLAEQFKKVQVQDFPLPQITPVLIKLISMCLLIKMNLRAGTKEER